jgi:hypothetical protein
VPNPFDHELKLRRALKHMKDLNGEVGAWLNGNHHSVRYEFDLNALGPPVLGPEGGNYMLGGPVFIPGQGPGTAPEGVQWGRGLMTALATAEKPPADPFSLLIGDSLHNLRSALDALAYALASAFTKPLPKEITNSSEFPVFGDEDGKGTSGVGFALFNQKTKKGAPAPGSGAFKIRGCDPAVQTIIEGLQPYKRGDAFRTHPLWKLHELDRISKHRLLHTTVAAFYGTTWETRRFTNVRCIGPGMIVSLSGAIETDTPISRIYGIHPIDPDAEMHVEIQPAIDVAFAPGTPDVENEPVLKTLASLYDYIVTDVLPPLSGYL